MSTKHTPGPWGLEDPMGPEILSIVANPQAEAYDWIMVAQIGTSKEDGDRRSMKEHVANAKLLAAAPELLEALQPFAAFADAMNEAVPDTIAIGIYADGAMRFGPNGGATLADLRRAREAIAKAEGRS